MFELTDQPIDGAALRARLARPDAGACVVFEGWVRNHHAGRPVTKLEYEAFDELARLEGAAIMAEAGQSFPGCTVLCVHRTGSLPVGEMAVWVGAVSPHRHAAFLACRQVIEEVKKRLPVWKKEHHPDGAAEWVNCTAEAVAARLSEKNYYARQMALPEVGEAGQTALGAADVLVVGAGGLGCPASHYLATAGVGRLTLVDAGKIEVSNLHRQILFTADDVGANKVVVAAARLRACNPLARVEALPVDATPGNIRTLVAGRTVVLDCTDNFASRFLLHDACRQAGVPLVQAAVHRFEGELNLFRPGDTGCLHCLWSGRPAAQLEGAENCSGGPVFAPAVGLLGILQAAEAIKLILGLPVDGTHTRLVNLLDGTTLAIERAADPACPVCGAAAVQTSAPRDDGTVSAVVLDEEALLALGAVQWVVLLEAGESLEPAAARPQTTILPLHDLAGLRELAGRGNRLVLACRHGLRSAALARLLRAEGFGQVYALAGAMTAIRRATAQEIR